MQYGDRCMIQIAICDDDFQVCSQLEDYIRRWKEGRRLEVEIFNTGKEFEEALKERHYDLIFLDLSLIHISEPTRP